MPRPPSKPCSVDGCDLRGKWNGMCQTHNRRTKLYGGPLNTAIASSKLGPEGKLQFHGWTEVHRVPGLAPCWEFNGPLSTSGYGTVSYEGKRRPATRLAYEAWVGPVPDGAYMCHKCDNPPCINPDHIYAGSQLENVHDAISRGRAYVPEAVRGSAQHHAKLTENEVRRIRELRAAGLTLKAIAAKYGVAYTNIQKITTRQSWAWLDADTAGSDPVS